MNPPDDLTALAPLVQLLEQLGAPYFIGGSVASSVYGVYRTTADADIIADLALSHVDPLVQALQGDYYASSRMISSAIMNKSTFNLIHLPTMFKLDIFAVKPREYDGVALSRRRQKTLIVEASELEVMLATPEDVLLSKLEWYRLGNEVSERQLLDVIGVIKVQRKHLDYDYLDRWAAEIGVGDLLAGAMAEVEADEARRGGAS